VPAAEVIGELGLKRFHFRAEDVPAAREDPFDGGPVSVRVGRETRAQVVEWDGERGHRVIHDAGAHWAGMASTAWCTTPRGAGARRLGRTAGASGPAQSVFVPVELPLGREDMADHPGLT